jgi:hypothetical protein
VEVEESDERFVDERAYGVYSFFGRPEPRPRGGEEWGERRGPTPSRAGGGGAAPPRLGGAGGGGGGGSRYDGGGRTPAGLARSPSAAASVTASRAAVAPTPRPPSAGAAGPVVGRPLAPSRPASEPARAGGVTAGGLRRGTKVRHPTLGAGVVMEVEGDGPSGRLTVYFERFGKRKLVAQYAKLEPI